MIKAYLSEFLERDILDRGEEPKSCLWARKIIGFLSVTELYTYDKNIVKKKMLI